VLIIIFAKKEGSNTNFITINIYERLYSCCF